MLTQAEQRIGYIFNFVERPDGFHEQDWKIWRLLIQNSYRQVTNEEFRKKGFEILRFFNCYFHE